MDSGAIVASCNDLAARATAARAALLSLCEALSALVPVAPASGAPATEPRRTVGAVVRWGSAEWIVVKDGEGDDVLRRLSYPEADTCSSCNGDEFVRWATREECERHGIPYVARPLPGAPLAAPSPAATPAAWVPSVGESVTVCDDEAAWFGEAGVVTKIKASGLVSVRFKGESEARNNYAAWQLRPATSSERAAAGLPVDESASESAEADESHAAWMAHREATSSGAMKPGQWDSYRAGWLARARVAARGGAS